MLKIRDKPMVSTENERHIFDKKRNIKIHWNKFEGFKLKIFINLVDFIGTVLSLYCTVNVARFTLNLRKFQLKEQYF